MALGDYGTESLIVTVNDRLITDWGETDPPFTHNYPNEVGTMRKGLGGGAVRLDLVEPGQEFTLNLNPGSPDSAYINGLRAAKETIIIAHSQLGTLEAGVGTEGMVTNRTESGRGGQTITDDTYVIMCNKYSETRGGE